MIFNYFQNGIWQWHTFITILMKLSILKHVPVVIRYIPKYPHPLPTICTPCIVKVAKKNPYWLRSYHCFISFSELSVQKSSYSHKHACCNLVQHKDLSTISCYIVDCHIVSGPLLQWLYLYTQYCIPVHKYLHTVVLSVQSTYPQSCKAL